MWLIAESGSTSTDWLLLDNEDRVMGEFKSPGINPTFLKEERISEIILENLSEKIDFDRIKEVYFFAAGCSSERLHDVARRGLLKVFKNARTYVDHDMTACAFACYDGEPCVCCIIGTGSNSIYFDGINLREEVPSLAYILGDEASGVYFSKELLRNYFYKQLPEDLHLSFVETYGEIEIDYFIKRVYEQERPNAYLASFMPFMIAHKSQPFIRDILIKGIKEFIKYQVHCYPEASAVPTHFVGSVASLLRDEIIEVGVTMGIRPERFLQQPVRELKTYLSKNRKRLLP